MPPSKKTAVVPKTSTPKSATSGTRSTVQHNTRFQKSQSVNLNKRDVKSSSTALQTTKGSKITVEPNPKKGAKQQSKQTPVRPTTTKKSAVPEKNKPSVGFTTTRYKAAISTKSTTITKPIVTRNHLTTTTSNKNINQKKVEAQKTKQTSSTKSSGLNVPLKRKLTSKTDEPKHKAARENVTKITSVVTKRSVPETNKDTRDHEKDLKPSLNVVVENVVEQETGSESLLAKSDVVSKDSKSSQMLAKMLVSNTTDVESLNMSSDNAAIHKHKVTELLDESAVNMVQFIPTQQNLVELSFNQDHSGLNNSIEETISSNEKCTSTEIKEVSSQPVILTSSTPIHTTVTTTGTTQYYRVGPATTNTIEDAVINKSESANTETFKPNHYDNVFDNVSAIVKDDITAIPGMKAFILSKLPSITGISASQCGHRVTISGTLMTLLTSWQVLEKMSKLFGKLNTSADHSYSDQLVTVQGKTSNTSESQNVSKTPLAKLSSVLGKLGNVEADDSIEDERLADVIEKVKKNIVRVSKDQNEEQQNDEINDGQSHLGIVVKIEKTESKDLDETETIKGYVCKICSRDCYSQVSLACHMTINHSNESDVSANTCYICNMTLNTQTELLLHIKDYHEKTEGTSFQCSLCNKTFCKQRYLKTHLKRHSGIKNHECPICHWKFFERSKLKWHMESHKEVGQRNLPYKCNVCSKSFYNRPSWSDHMNIHSGQKPFKCEICAASFGHRMGLKRHELVHKKDCPFSCTYCGKGFKIMSKLKEHLVRHTGVGDHTCSRCGKVYTTLTSLKRHNCSSVKILPEGEVSYVSVTEADTISEINEAEPTQYMCSECNAIFSSLEEAEVHAFTHSSQLGIQEYEVDLGNGKSKVVYVNNSEEVGTATEALLTIDGGYVTYQDDTTDKHDDEQIVASTLADLSSMNDKIV